MKNEPNVDVFYNKIFFGAPAWPSGMMGAFPYREVLRSLALFSLCLSLTTLTHHFHL